jgi:cytochrome c2/mono/diheme cytochrome c family protein
MSKFLKVLTGAALLTASAAHAEFGLGRDATPDEVAAWNIDIRPDGQGLPEGSGDVYTGEELWLENCSVCHGDFAEGAGRWPVLAGGFGSLKSDRPVKTIGSYWPYLSTVYDYVNRAMPFGNAQSLSADDVYALTAYLMYSNDLVDDEFELSKENFLEVQMPNEPNFILDDRLETEFPLFTVEACMEGCKDSVEITKRAAFIDVTPDGAGGGDLEGGGGAPAAAAEAPAAEEAPVAEQAPTADGEVAAEAPAALDMALVAEGEGNFRQCKSCHQVGEGAKNRSGPVLNGVVGRAAGIVDGFRYSGDMTDAGAGGLVWTQEELTSFLADPKAYMPGTKMTFRGVRDEANIAGIIEYLKSFPE